MKAKWFESIKKITAWVVLTQMLLAVFPVSVATATVEHWSIDSVVAVDFSDNSEVALDGAVLNSSEYSGAFDIRAYGTGPGGSPNCVQYILDGTMVGQDSTEEFELFGGLASFESSLFPDGNHTLVVNLFTGSTCAAGSEKDTSGDINFQTYGFYSTTDTAAPAAPIGLGFVSVDRGTSFDCGDTTTLQPVIPVWNDNIEEDFHHYEYTSFHPNGSVGLDEMVLIDSEFVNSWMPPADGVYGFAVRAVDESGNKSAWALSAETLAGSCQIIYETVEEPVEDYPTAPEIVFPSNEQYFNISPILNDWTEATDDDGICQYQIEYVYDDHHAFPDMPYRYTDDLVTWRNHFPGLSEQGGVTIRVRAMDCDDNYGEWSDSVHYYYDATAPAAPVVTGFENPNLACGAITNTHSVTVQWSDSLDNLGIAGYNYEIDYPLPGGGRGLWSPFFPTPPYGSQYSGTLNEGTHYIRVRALDNAGLYSAWSNTCSITADWSAPDVTIETPANNATLSGTVEIRGSVVDDNPHHYWFAVTGPGGVNVTLPWYQMGTINEDESFGNRLLAAWDTTDFPDGVYVIKLEARDAANNKDAGSVDWHTVTVDNSQPTVDIDYYLGTGGAAIGFKVVFSENVKETEAEDPANYYLSNWPDYSSTSGDLLGDATIVYDSATRTATITFSNPGWYVSPEQLWGVQDIHDLAGNLQLVNPYEEYSTPMVDPVTGAFLTGTLGLGGDYVTNVDVSLVAFDPAVGSGVHHTYYNLDGNGYVEGTDFTVSDEGYHVVTFYSVDWAGNEEEERSISFTIDKTGPSFDFVLPTPNPDDTITGDAFEAWIRGEGIEYCTITLNGGEPIEMTPDEELENYALRSLILEQELQTFWHGFDNLNDGVYRYVVTCYDEEGNPTSQGRTVTIANPTEEEEEEEGGGGTIIRVLTPIVAAAAPVTPAPAVAGATDEPEEVAAVDQESSEEEEEVKGSSDKLCPWWWIIGLLFLASLGFMGAVVKGEDEDGRIRNYYYLWPPILGGVAWLLHNWLHNDFKATWFCDNYWLVILVIALVAEVIFRSLAKHKKDN
jgi:hypothetical protein